MLKNKSYTIALVLVLAGCDEIVTTQSAKDALDMCHYAALKVIKGSGAVEFPSSFHNPFRDPTVVRLRYTVINSEVSGTVRCYFDEDTDNRTFTRITVDLSGVEDSEIDVPEADLANLTINARLAIK